MFFQRSLQLAYRLRAFFTFRLEFSGKLFLDIMPERLHLCLEFLRWSPQDSGQEAGKFLVRIFPDAKKAVPVRRDRGIFNIHESVYNFASAVAQYG